MENFNALLTLSELKTLYSGKPVGICPLYKGVIGTTKTFEATGNPITIPEYKELVKLTTKFSPKQAGTGDPSPDNVRPISGWDIVKVTVSNESVSHDYDITLPETIYGGTVDAVTGEGEKTWEFVEFDGSENWRVSSNYISSVIDKPSNTNPGIGYCSHFIFKYNYLEDNVFVSNSYVFLGKAMSSKYTVESWKQYLSQQFQAGTPVTIAYQLATPEPFEISQVSIPSLGGENNFFTNAENMDIIYNETSFWG